MDRSDASALADLQMHWDEAYVIRLDGAIWSASFRGSADEFRAHTSSELRELIRSDYAYRQRAGLTGRDPGDEDRDADPADGDASDSGGEPAEDVTSTRHDAAGSDDPVGERAMSAAARQYAAEVNFAAIRGERMST